MEKVKNHTDETINNRIVHESETWNWAKDTRYAPSVNYSKDTRKARWCSKGMVLNLMSMVKRKRGFRYSPTEEKRYAKLITYLMPVLQAPHTI